MPRAAILALVAGLVLAAPATAAEITGPARVIDGDTLDMPFRLACWYRAARVRRLSVAADLGEMGAARIEIA